MVDVADRWMCSRLDFEVLKCLAQHPDIPAILVLNKVHITHRLRYRQRHVHHQKLSVLLHVDPLEHIQYSDLVLLQVEVSFSSSHDKYFHLIT